MKVMILSGRFGFGHEMAANAIREEFERQNHNTEIIQKDMLAYFYPHISRLVYKVFSLVAERCHQVYNMVYRMSERMNAEIRQGGSMLYFQFKRMMEEESPDLIVCTHPICVKAAAFYKAKTGSQVPLVSCITDTTIHMGWVADEVDTYLVPTPEMKEYLAGMGTWADVLVTGIPVRQQFLESASVDEKEWTGRRVLVMGGGLGIMPELEELIGSLHRMPDVHTTVVTGKNQALYQKWAGRYEDVDVLGYVENIGTYIIRSDLVITKAGGVTMYELIHSKTPMFIIHPFLEQEIMNAGYAAKRGIARVIWSQDEDFAEELLCLLTDPERLSKMQECMQRAEQEMIDTSLCEAVREISRKACRYIASSDYLLSDCFSGFGRMQAGLEGSRRTL